MPPSVPNNPIPDPGSNDWVDRQRINIERARSDNRRSVPNRLMTQTFDISNGIWLNDTRESTPPEVSSSNSTQSESILTPEREQLLYTAKRVLHKERSDRMRARPRPIASKERGWFDHIENKKLEDTSTIELISSEIPVAIDELPSWRITELRNMRLTEVYEEGTNVIFRCYRCSLNTPWEFSYFCDGHLYCSEHVPDLKLCGACGELKDECISVKTYDSKNTWICPRCFDARDACSSCGRDLPNTNKIIGVCNRCIESADGSNPGRNFSHSLKWVNTKAGKIIKSKRIFSSEIEALTSYRDWAERLAGTTPREVGLSTDGSLHGKGYGFELQTPRLAGESGEELIYRVTTAVHNIGATVNETCGMHIHLDGDGIIYPDRRAYPSSLIQLWKAYIVYENVLISFLPFSRRRNDYCRPLSEAFQLIEIDTLHSLIDAEKLWYKERAYSNIRRAKGHHYHTSRYFGVNLNSLFSQGHLEIRTHSGTTNPRKILEWANLHALIVDAAANKKFTTAFLNESQATSDLKEKTDMLFTIIGLSETSKQYFRTRQGKFGDKKNLDEETQLEIPRGFEFVDAPSVVIPPVTMTTTGSTMNQDLLNSIYRDLLRRQPNENIEVEQTNTSAPGTIELSDEESPE